MKYYKTSYNSNDIKIIVANSEYEALGYYLLEVLEGDGYALEVDIEEVSPDHKIEVECIGIPVYKTVEEIHKEKQFWDTPSVIVGLVE